MIKPIEVPECGKKFREYFGKKAKELIRRLI